MPLVTDRPVLSKRKLLLLVQQGIVSGWDDPRMPTLSGMRRRGYTAEAIRTFCGNIGVSKTNGIVEFSMLEYFLREDLNKKSARVMAVLDPVKVVIDNFPVGQVDHLEAVNHPDDPSMGTRTVPFSRVIYIERDDFREDPPKQYYRLSPGREVRLRYAYFVTCTGVVKNEQGEVIEVHCTYDPASKGGNSPDGRKVKSTIHWVSADQALDAEVRLFGNLFGDEQGEEFNPESMTVIPVAKVEPSVGGAPAGAKYQFERVGYFTVDKDSLPGKLVFNRTVALRDTWAKIEKKGG